MPSVYDQIMSLCTLILVDDHPLMRDALRNLFDAEPGFQVLGEASEGAEAVQKCLELDPDVVLMDIRMPGMDGIEATAEIVQQAPRSKVLALTTFSTLEYVVPALRAGASGYLVKDARHEEIVSAVLQVREDEMTLSQSVANSLANNVLGDVPVPSVRRSRSATPSTPPAAPAAASQQSFVPDLTARELETLRWIAKGLNNNEIADQMKVSHGSVKAYVSQLCDKLGARDRVQVLIAGIQSGLVEPELTEDLTQ
ncbi:DNA-binding response regulator [Kocuria sp. WRN011]|uniref:response regulator transcription factor n=2 Tax=Micrococcaceae TaxID=1268 RepID=UPI000BB0BE86|nr:response regulator transcription factor [Kocuria carniphila]MCT1803309.1 response regulator transcription factor [Kocuria carniphila]PBB09786.1 DNA-binding response regulator [Kocuria sp. WRN011]PZP37206.1 MAG: DNA-binding response regulator [Kocuria rhizophila]